MDDWKKANPGKPVGPGGADMLIRMNDSHRPLRSWAFGFIEWTGEMDILDVGCGGGAAIYEMISLSENSRVWGIDYSDESVRLSKELNSMYLNKRVFIYGGDVSSLPFENEKFDLVTAIETVYFWPEISAGISEIFRVLRPGGKIAILCEVDGPERMNWEKVNFDIKVYRPKEIMTILTDSGFKNTEFKTNEQGYMYVTGKK